MIQFHIVRFACVLVLVLKVCVMCGSVHGICRMFVTCVLHM